METRSQKTPDNDHPIDIRPLSGRVTVTVAGKLIADSDASLVLHEASYPPVYYIPKSDIRDGVLSLSARTSYCPYKGDCTYYDIIADIPRADAAWSYDEPFAAVAAIRDHIAFYREKVDAITLQD